jgi:hypothetical protein
LHGLPEQSAAVPAERLLRRVRLRHVDQQVQGTWVLLKPESVGLGTPGALLRGHLGAFTLRVGPWLTPGTSRSPSSSSPPPP